MKVVIVGAGKVGKHISTSLATAGHDVLVLDLDRSVVEDARRSHALDNLTFKVADGCELSALQANDLRRADAVVAATGDDEDNLVVSLLAKQEFAVPRVVARVNHPKNQWLFNETWGIDVSVSAPHMLTAAVEEAVTVGKLVELLTLGTGGASIHEVRLPATAPSIDATIASLALPRECTVVAVIRDEQVIVPRGDTTLAADDEVVLLTTGDATDTVTEILLGR